MKQSFQGVIDTRQQTTVIPGPLVTFEVCPMIAPFFFLGSVSRPQYKVGISGQVQWFPWAEEIEMGVLGGQMPRVHRSECQIRESELWRSAWVSLQSPSAEWISNACETATWEPLKLLWKIIFEIHNRARNYSPSQEPHLKTSKFMGHWVECSDASITGKD